MSVISVEKIVDGLQHQLLTLAYKPMPTPNKKVEKRVRNIMCRIFGHTFDLIELAMLDIMQNGAINKESYKDEFVTCKRCSNEFSYTLPKKQGKKKLTK